MNSEIYLKAGELASAIAKSPEALELIRTENMIREDKVANNLAERWKRVYEKVSEIQRKGQELTEQDERSIEFIEAKVENHPVILEFIDAHQNFTNMLEEVNGILSSALTLDRTDVTDPCISCPTKRLCDTDPDSSTPKI